MLRSAKRGKVRLISHEIIFQEFQPITILQRYRQTDGWTDEQMVGQITCLGNTHKALFTIINCSNKT